MRISDIITSDAIAVRVHLPRKAAVLRYAAERLALSSGLDAKRIEEALSAREALGSTGIGGGVAVPHVCFGDLDKPHGVFLSLDEPIEFDAIDDKPVDLVCVIISPQGSGCGIDEPLSYLAAAARLLRNDKVTAALRKTGNSQAAHDIIVHSCVPAQLVT